MTRPAPFTLSQAVRVKADGREGSVSKLQQVAGIGWVVRVLLDSGEHEWFADDDLRSA